MNTETQYYCWWLDQIHRCIHVWSMCGHWWCHTLVISDHLPLAQLSLIRVSVAAQSYNMWHLWPATIRQWWNYSHSCHSCHHSNQFRSCQQHNPAQTCRKNKLKTKYCFKSCYWVIKLKHFWKNLSLLLNIEWDKWCCSSDSPD